MPNQIQWRREGDCIQCTSHAPNDRGYVFTTRGKLTISIPRQILARRHKSIPSGMVARHTCDRKWCINPNHIIIGTHADNMRDRDERHLRKPPKGTLIGRAKINNTDVIAIRDSSEATRYLQQVYGLSTVQISNIKSGRSWSHV
jgi:hypothetical protein